MVESYEYVVRINDGEYYEGMRESIMVINGQLYRVNPHNGFYMSYDLIDEGYIDMLSYTPLRRLLYLIHYNKEAVINAITTLEESEGEGMVEVDSSIPIEGQMVKIEGLTVSMGGMI